MSSSRRRGGAAAFARRTTVLDAARSLGVDIDSVCGGRGICGRCQVGRRRVVPEARHHVVARKASRRSGDVEAGYRTEKGLEADRRLGARPPSVPTA